MLLGIISILVGLLCLLLPKTKWFRDYNFRHNFSAQEEILNPIRKMVGIIFILIGSFFSIMSLI